MWNSQVEPSGNQSSSSSSHEQQQQKKLDYQDNSQIDSGFLSSEHILHSFNDDADHRAAPPEQQPLPKNTDDLDLKKVAPVASSAYFDSGLVEDFASGHGHDMLLEKDVGAVLAECLSHSLNLKKSHSLMGNSIGDSHINDLSASRKVVDTTSSNSTNIVDQRNISDAAAVAKDSGRFEMPEEEQPWERCYKQDADGET